MTSIIHISDLHFGSPYVPEVGDAVLRLIAEEKPSAVLCSGDIVQFAEMRSPWESAREFFQAIHAPVLTVPGNHDVFRFFPIRRWTQPLQYYLEYIHPGRDMALHLPGLSCVGVGTMRSWTIELGFITKQQLQNVQEEFANSGPENFRILVQHQAPRAFYKVIVPTQVRGHRRALNTYFNAGVDLILTGHNHFAHMETIEREGHRMVWSQCGTTTSNRLSWFAERENQLTQFNIRHDSFDAVTKIYHAETQTFVEKSVRTFPRNRPGSSP